MKKTHSLENHITDGVIWKQLLVFFFPIMLGSFFQQMYNTVDAIIVGKFVSKHALAAVGGVTGSLINLTIGFFVGLSSGATVLISQYYGAREHKEVSKAVHTAIAIALSAGCVLTIFGVIFAPQLLVMMNTPPSIMGHAESYLRIFFIGMVPSLLYNFGAGILRAVGDSRRPLYFLIAACFTNIVLDILFVVGLDMGVRGAAMATVISQVVSAVLVIITLMRTNLSCQLFWRKIRFHMDLMRDIVRIGFPTGGQSVLYSTYKAR